MKEINVVIPAAGNGSRFVEKGFKKPKPFIDVNGKTMIESVILNLKITNAKYHIIIREDHYQNEQDTVKYLQDKYNIHFILINKLTEGAACTTLFARKFIDNSTPLLFANSDQIVDCDINAFLHDAEAKNYDGSILTFRSTDSKWSFAEVDSNNIVIRTAEKQPISDIATVGIYYFKEGRIFVDGATDMIINNDRFHNEFYICPAYNYVIKNGYKIGIHQIDMSQMHGIGTPEDLGKYLQLTSKI